MKVYDDVYGLHDYCKPDAEKGCCPGTSCLSSSCLPATCCCRPDGTRQSRGSIDLPNISDRQALLDEWADKAVLLHASPLDKVRNYFGSKWAVYFLFLGDYTASLVFPAVAGLVAFLFGIGFIFDWGSGRPPDVELICNAACDGPAYSSPTTCGVNGTAPIGNGFANMTAQCTNLMCGVGCDGPDCTKTCLSDQCFPSALSYAYGTFDVTF